MWSRAIMKPVFKLRPKPGRQVLFSAVPLPCPVQPQLKIPLHLRAPAFRVTITDLKLWHTWAKNRADSVGSSFLNLDNGPDSENLSRELKWLVEDAIERTEVVSALNSGQLCDDDTEVCVRASLDDLYKLWRQRIEERRPFQYLVGCEHWRDLVLSVQEGILIPRPETELILDLVSDALKVNEDLKNGFWADLGTGSGALAIGLARLLGSSCPKVFATDLSLTAFTVASFNVKRYNLQDRITVKLGSWFNPLEDVKGELSGIVSNPPYIPSRDIEGLQAEVSKHEPRIALDGGENGTDDLVHLCDGAASMLKHGGFFAFETNGEAQCNFVADYLESRKKGSFCSIKIVSDFAGIQRFVTGYKP